MEVYQSAIENKKKFIIWGCGNYLKQISDKIDPKINILYVCDSDKEKWGRIVTSRKLKCTSPDILKKYNDVVVLIAIKNKKNIYEIKRYLEMTGISYCHINQAIVAYQNDYEKEQIEKYDHTIGRICEPDNLDLLKYFISISVPVQTCQLKCKYCYIGQNGGFENDEIVLPSAQFIRKALSRKRLNGTALINICGVGETLLCKELFFVIRELLEEKHYVSVITNTLLTEEIRKYVQLPFELRKKLFFKCSLHYRQFKEKDMLKVYAENVNRIWDSGASISVELVPEDELIPYIGEIKEFCEKNFGALPHVTVTRDEGKKNMPVLTEYSNKEYKEIWNQFDSSMFSFKLDHMQKRREYCIAGKNSFLLSLESGDISACPSQNVFFNIYEDISKKICFEEVGFKCNDTYCRNAHAYLTLGMIKEINDCSYFQIRNRMTNFKKNWVSKEMEYIFKQRICDNIE